MNFKVIQFRYYIIIMVLALLPFQGEAFAGKEKHEAAAKVIQQFFRARLAAQKETTPANAVSPGEISAIQNSLNEVPHAFESGATSCKGDGKQYSRVGGALAFPDELSQPVNVLVQPYAVSYFCEANKDKLWVDLFPAQTYRFYGLDGSYSDLMDLIQEYHGVEKTSFGQLEKRAGQLEAIASLATRKLQQPELNQDVRDVLSLVVQTARNKSKYLGQLASHVPRELARHLSKERPVTADGAQLLSYPDYYGELLKHLDPAHRLYFPLIDKFVDETGKHLPQELVSYFVWMEDKDQNGFESEIADTNYRFPEMRKVVFDREGKAYIKAKMDGVEPIRLNDQEHYLIPSVPRRYEYNIDENADMYINPQVRKHSNVNRGKMVRSAGFVQFKDGKIIEIDNNSGHYKPSNSQVENSVFALREKYGLDIFHSTYNGPTGLALPLVAAPIPPVTPGHFLFQTPRNLAFTPESEIKLTRGLITSFRKSPVGKFEDQIEKAQEIIKIYLGGSKGRPTYDGWKEAVTLSIRLDLLASIYNKFRALEAKANPSLLEMYKITKEFREFYEAKTWSGGSHLLKYAFKSLDPTLLEKLKPIESIVSDYYFKIPFDHSDIAPLNDQQASHVRFHMDKILKASGVRKAFQRAYVHQASGSPYPSESILALRKEDGTMVVYWREGYDIAERALDSKATQQIERLDLTAPNDAVIKDVMRISGFILEEDLRLQDGDKTLSIEEFRQGLGSH